MMKSSHLQPLYVGGISYLICNVTCTLMSFVDVFSLVHSTFHKRCQKVSLLNKTKMIDQACIGHLKVHYELNFREYGIVSSVTILRHTW